MKKGIKKIAMIVFAIIVILFLSILTYFKITGNVMSGPPEGAFGPSSTDISCMKSCMTPLCPNLNDTTCTSKYSSQCLSQCNMQGQPAPADEGESCMQSCVVNGCVQYDFACQNANRESCEKECNMIKEPEPKNEEQKCISDCVNLHAKGTICKPSAEGEQGNDVCKMCAQQCVHLYSGPCLNEEKLEAKKSACQTCEHCYGSPVMGDSGEGWECIINVECKDSSNEFGDNPGTGEGILAKTGEAIGNSFESIIDFFKGFFT